jgi:septum formation protein
MLMRQAGIEPLLRAPDVDEEAVIDEVQGGRRASCLPTSTFCCSRDAKPPTSRLLVRDCPTSTGRRRRRLDVRDRRQVLGKPLRPRSPRHGGSRCAADGRAALGPQRHPRPPREPAREEHAVAAAAVTFVSDVSDAEIAAYVATGEPLQVAGAFTVDSLGGPFIERVDGDPSTVVGMSLSTVRRLCKALGVVWTDLWTSSPHRDGTQKEDATS